MKHQKKYNIICIGQLIQDILVVNIPEDALTRYSTLADELILSSGGDAANECCTIARLGSEVTLYAKVEKGPAGDSLISNMRSEASTPFYSPGRRLHHSHSHCGDQTGRRTLLCHQRGEKLRAPAGGCGS